MFTKSELETIKAALEESLNGYKVVWSNALLSKLGKEAYEEYGWKAEQEQYISKFEEALIKVKSELDKYNLKEEM